MIYDRSIWDILYYLFVFVTISIILSSIHRGTLDTGLKMSFGTVIRWTLQTIPYTSSAHLSSFYLAMLQWCEIERIRGDRTPAAGLNKRWNLISCLRPAIESREGTAVSGSAMSRRKEEEEEKDRVDDSPSLFGYRRDISSASVTR